LRWLPNDRFATTPTGPFVHWVHDGEARVHRLMTRERFPYLHDLLASTSMDGEDSLWADLDARLTHWQGQSWREDRVMVAALAAEARRFSKRYPVGDRHRRAAWWALGGAMAREDCMGALLSALSVLDGEQA
jgi:hypothetical protein